VENPFVTLLPEDIIALKKRSKVEDFQYIYFWKTIKEPDGSLGPGCFSQWWPAPFKVGEQSYPTAEHFMMYSKASLFEDKGIAEEILRTESCSKVKALGRQVKDFDSQLWMEHRFAVVLRANLAKFSQNEELKDYIFSTGDAILVEASPTDVIWGIGMAEDEARVSSPSDWRGMNLLGFALMRTRSLLESGLEYVSEFINMGHPTLDRPE
jgi:ribA/ribD-fused uncharacterized protein